MVRDYVSRDLSTAIHESEQEHVDWLTTQQQLTSQMGEQNYVQLQFHAPNATDG